MASKPVVVHTRNLGIHEAEVGEYQNESEASLGYTEGS